MDARYPIRDIAMFTKWSLGKWPSALKRNRGVSEKEKKGR
jgi:hypothetical protein